MEWVETTGKTVEEAKDRALDLLGVDERDAEFDVLEEAKVGFLGRMKNPARVRARVRPAAPRPKTERRDRRRRKDEPKGNRDRSPAGSAQAQGAVPSQDVAVATESASQPLESIAAGDATSPSTASRSRRRRRSGSGGGNGSDGERRAASAEDAGAQGALPSDNKGTEMPELSLADQGRVVSEFLEGLVTAFGLEATTSWHEVDEDNVEVRVDGEGLGLLVGPKGRTLQAVTEVARSVVVRHGEGLSPGRVHIDVAGYRQRRREALARFTHEVAQQVIESGKARALEAMSPADRKVVHDTVNEIDGVASTSEGEEPNRRVVINPA